MGGTVGTGRRALSEEVPMGFKRSEVGVIPEDWQCLRFGDAVNLLTGFPFSSSGYVDSGFLLVRGSNIKRGTLDWGDEITQYWPEITSEVAKYELRKGDLVIAMDGALVGRSYAVISIADLPSLLLQRVARIRSSQLHQDLLRFLVASDSFVNHVNSTKTHTAIPHISSEDIRSFLIAVPSSTKEQRAIAQALLDVDGLLTVLETLIAKKRAVKQAAMQQLLTGKTRLPGFRGKWKKMPLGDITSIRNQMVVPADVNPETPCVELDHIGQGDGRLLGCSTAQRSVSTKYRFFAGDVLFGRLRPYLRKYWHADRDGICTTEIWPLMVNPRHADSSFLHAVVQSERFIGAASISYGTHMPRADWGVMKNLEVRLPQVQEQETIAIVLTDMGAELTALERRRNKIRAVKQGMMQQLLTGRVRLVKPDSKSLRGCKVTIKS